MLLRLLFYNADTINYKDINKEILVMFSSRWAVLSWLIMSPENYVIYSCLSYLSVYWAIKCSHFIKCLLSTETVLNILHRCGLFSGLHAPKPSSPIYFLLFSRKCSLSAALKFPHQGLFTCWDKFLIRRPSLKGYTLFSIYVICRSSVNKARCFLKI